MPFSARNRVTISRVSSPDHAFHLLRADHPIELRALGGMSSPLDRSFSPAQNPYSDPSMMESETDKSFSQSAMLQSAQKRINTNDATIAQREREINDIAKGIIELADIFKELQTMVIDQGTMLDRIDYNVETMTIDVKAAEKELVVVSTTSYWFSTSIDTDYAGYGIPEEDYETEDHIAADIDHFRYDHCLSCKTKAQPKPNLI